jgi:hypothetical protein
MAEIVEDDMDEVFGSLRRHEQKTEQHFVEGAVSPDDAPGRLRWV